MDAVLLFDVLMFLNIFYYPLVAIVLPVVTLCKYLSPKYKTPNLIVVDASVVATLMLSDLLKLLVFRKLRDRHRVLAVIMAVLLTCLSAVCTLYLLLVQEKATKMEYLLCTMTFVLFANEFAFGTLQFLPCGKKSEYK